MKKLVMYLMAFALICGAASAGVNPADANLGKEEDARIHGIRQEIAVLLQEVDALKAMGADYGHLKERIADLNGQLPAPPRDSGSLDEGGETCSTAVVIPSLPYCDTGNTSDNVDDYQPAAGFDCAAVGSGGLGPDVVYEYTPVVTQIVTISLCGSVYDTYLHVYANACPGDPDAVQVCCDDDFCDFQPNGLASCCLEVVLTPGPTYYIIVDGWGSNSAGDYTLNVIPFTGFCPEEPCDQPPECEPDYCDTLRPWEGPWCLEGSTVGAGDDCPTRPSEDEIWKLVIEQACDYRFEMCSKAPNGDPCAWDSYLYLDANCCDPTGGHIALADDGCEDAAGNPCFGMSHIDCVFLQPGTYYLLVEGFFSGDAGDYVINVETCCNLITPGDLPCDMGDLPRCDYPTLFNNPGHLLSDIAWLGPMVDGEPAPNILDLDMFDDGVTYHNLPWTPCEVETVTVVVTAGGLYTSYLVECCGCLYLNGWKDGNLDGDFCDTLCREEGLFADEWIVQDVLVTPGTWTFPVTDPGVLNQGVYDGVFRWRLTSRPVGREGFGLWDPTACVNAPECGTFAKDFLGEVEDYILADAQLSVELNGFDAIPGDEEVTLNWSTASETDNDHFDVLRDGTIMGRVEASNSATGGSYSWTDVNLTNGREYNYTLVSVDINSVREEIATISATPTMSAATVTEYALHQNYPNPFNPETSIAFDLVEAHHVTLAVYNQLGQTIATLVNGSLPAGRHTITFEATDLPSGIYFYRIEAEDFHAVKKMVLMK